jgi:glycerophosphoryl diester phosphodiesterase
MRNAPARPERVAHRGSPTLRTENTLPSFLLALEHGADAVELDAHVTRDRVAVVHHDEVVRGRPISRTDWDDLSRVELAAGDRIPRLQDVLTALGDRVAVYIELKGAGIEDFAIEIARAYGSRFAVHSFDHDTIARAATKAPDIPRGVLLDRGTKQPADELRLAADRTRPRDVWPHWSLVDGAFMTAARELGTRVIPWTVNSADTATSLIALGVDGIFTDDVRILADLGVR